MRVTSIALGALTLILLIMVPVGGAPVSLQKGSQASYHLSISMSFSPPICGSSPIVTAQSTIVCPMIVSLPTNVNVTGTLGWTATGKSSTAVNLTVARDLTISSDDTTTMPDLHFVRSFNETIDLGTRIVSIMPLIMPEMEQALQMAQSSQVTSPRADTTWNSAMNMIEPPTADHAVRTMWWVNGPLKANQTVQVLVFPTNVTGPTNIDLGSLGQRPAWSLVFKPRPLPLPPPETTQASVAPIVSTPQVVLTFNYDQKSDLLLSASADIHLGFLSTFQVQCDPSTSMCPSGLTPTTIVRTSGLNIHASLTLTSISHLDLDQTAGSTNSSGETSSSGSGSGSGISSGSASGTGSGTGTGGGAGTGESGSDGSSGAGNGQGPTSVGSGNGPLVGTSPQPKLPASGLPSWIYWILGLTVVAAIASGLWITRGRKKRNPTSSAQPAN